MEFYKMQTQLLCLFTTVQELNDSLKFIMNNYTLVNPNLFVLESKSKQDELFITFNVAKGSEPVHSIWKTILVHRKKQSNTIYTINALNEVVKSRTGGQVDSTFRIDWDQFKNCILASANGTYKRIPTTVYKCVNINNFEINSF